MGMKKTPETTEKRLLLLYNPHAGKSAFLRSLAKVIDSFVKEGWEVEAYPTQGPMDAVRKIKTMDPGITRVVAAGGDGTLDEVVTGLLLRKKQIPIGYLPVGTMNDFAASLGIPKGIDRQLEIALHGETSPVDIGLFNDNVFVYVAAFGAFTDVSYRTDQTLKKRFGAFAYYGEVLKELPSIPSIPVEIEANGETIRDEVAFGMITNSLSVGGVRKITGKDVSLSDGVFEVTLIRRPENLLEMQRLVNNGLSGKMDHPLITTLKASHLIIRFEEAVAWTLDGEYGGEFTEVDILNKKQWLPMIVPGEKS